MSEKVSLTNEQQAIVDFVKILLNPNTKYNSMAIKAFAGCGKSFVLKQIAFIFPNIKILGLAFNNSIATENKNSFPKKNTKWFTVHGFAKEYLKKFNANIDFKNSHAGFKPIELLDILEIKNKSDYLLGTCINDVMKVYCQSALKKITLENIIKAAKSQLNDEVMQMNKKYLEAACLYANKMWTLFETNKIPPTFDFYLKYFEVKEYPKKIKDFDLLELDEAQDSNAVTMSIITQLPTKNIYVGDEHQSIYAFRGTLNAMNYADKLFYLSTTFRYIPEIANFASKILKGYKGEKVPIKSLAKKQIKVDGKKAYLSRNNSSMIALIAKLITEEKPFRTVKNPDDIFETAIALLEFRLEKKVTNKKFFYFNKKFQDFEQVKEYIDETNDNELQSAYKMQRQYKKGIFFLKKQAKEYYKSKEDIDTILTTAHSSKGLEWDKVELLKDFPDIKKLLKEQKITTHTELINKAKKGDLKANNIIQEINLYYVAITRARFNFK